MLTQAMEQGARDACARFKVAEGFMSGVARAAIGQPGRAFTEGAGAFRDGGFLSPKNVFWPPTSGPGGSKLNWIDRARTLSMPLSAMAAMRSNKDDGPLANALGAVGGIAGSMYGYPALGFLGAPVAGAVGSRLGRGLGHLLGSRPKVPRAEEPL